MKDQGFYEKLADKTWSKGYQIGLAVKVYDAFKDDEVKAKVPSEAIDEILRRLEAMINLQPGGLGN